MFISRTPYRLSFYGGSLDYKGWYQKNSIKVICAGLDYYCYQSVRRIPKFFDHKYRICYSKIESASCVDDIKHPSAREIIRKYSNNSPLEISYTGDLPARSGIGSSSAFTVGLINSMRAINNKYIGRTELALEAIDFEQNVLKEVVGIQDQCASAFGGLILIEADKQSIRPRRFIINPDYLNYLQDNLLMGFDGISRNSQVAAKNVIASISKEEKNDMFLELADLNSQGVEFFSEQESIDKHALITKKIRDIKLQLNGDRNIEKINQIIFDTESSGSLCTRFMGAGGGGFFICWAPKSSHEAIKNSVKIKTWVDVKFCSSGSQIIFCDQ
ncbi:MULTISPECIES: hypothetical protein [Prochlorococcus]|uniref:D,D-heptose 7-phosphate kinase n=1 Tax=Prochlorococcus marinus str. MIT 9314 TaxID=167548 RepID=A0A0A2AHN2_PROMR|nr:hypothetical protein [Prochlorococcus marinus]KGG00322.1 D,D-heptose 7-phosphate kinase [Prochlorococcus marinus str. MIT 9314]